MQQIPSNPICLECPVAVRGIGRHSLSAVPHFYDFSAVEAYQVHNVHSIAAGTQDELRVHCNKVAICKRVLYYELLVRKLEVIFFHRFLQRGETCGEKRIVMLAVQIYVFFICLIDTTCHNHFQELNSSLFAAFRVWNIFQGFLL
jgi:hypothetical protein